jgi:seryl-tRNA synthetase
MLENFEQEGLRRDVNLLQKEIGQIKKAKGDATELLEKKNALDKRIAELGAEVAALGKKRDRQAGMIGNIVDKACHVSSTEVGVV